MPLLRWLPLIPALVLASWTWDDFETAGATAPGGGPWITYQDSTSSGASWSRAAGPGADGSGRCGRLQARISSISGYAGASGSLLPGFAEKDLSSYAGIRFWARTNAGTLKVQIPTTPTNTIYNHYEAPVLADTSWRLFEVPFASLKQTWGTASAWAPARALQVGFLLSNNSAADLWAELDDIAFYTSSEETVAPDTGVFVSPFPKVDQVGYEPLSRKWTAITAPFAQAGDSFWVADTVGNRRFGGVLQGAFNDTLSSGEFVLGGDFTPFQVQGRWRIEVGSRHSATFSIRTGVHQDLYRNALRCFRTIRCGAEVHDERTGLAHPPCHPQDTLNSADGGHGDFHGGWHNAGDYGKWTTEASVTVASFLWLAELDRRRSGREPQATSALLDEARWGLEWILRMQRPDGSFFHKVDAEPQFAWGTRPEDDHLPRWASLQGKGATSASSIDAADACAVLAQGARVFSTLDNSWSRRLGEASDRSWGWVAAHPGIGEADRYYTDANSQQEELWARAEHARRAPTDSLDRALAEKIAQLPKGTGPSWLDPSLFGVLAASTDSQALPLSRTAALAHLSANASVLAAKSNGSPYRTVLGPDEFWWGSNETLLFRGLAMAVADAVQPDSSQRQAALAQLDHVLGMNALDTSFVAGFGQKAIRRPYHWSTQDYGTPLPGWVTGGPNHYAATLDQVANDQPLYDLVNVRKTPPAKSFLDLCSSSGSYASNEGQTTEQAALVFLSGWFSGPGAWADQRVDAIVPRGPSRNLPSPGILATRQGAGWLLHWTGPTRSPLMVLDPQGRLLDRVPLDAQGVGNWTAPRPGLYLVHGTPGTGSMLLEP